MPHLKKSNQATKAFYRPEQSVCPICGSKLVRDHIVWRKYVIFSTGDEIVTSWGYCCNRSNCSGAKTVYRSAKAEKLHLRQRRFSRELVVRIGFRHFWQHQTMDEIHEWLTQALQVQICEREVGQLLLDFLALLGAGQPKQIQHKLANLTEIIVSMDGMQPEKGNDCLYIVRKVQSGVTLLAVSVEESSEDALRAAIFEPLKKLTEELKLVWRGVISDAQESLRLAVAHGLKDVPHQACQSHCL